MAVTEVGCMGVKPSFDVTNDATAEGQILTKLYNYVITAPGGPNRVYWGLEAEDPTYLWGFFDWNSIEDHENFARTLGQEAVKDMPKILSRGFFTKHITATPTLSTALQSRATEIILAYFPQDTSSTQRDSAIGRLQNFEDDLKSLSGIQALSYGWGVEKDFPVRGGSDDQKASILMSFAGLDSTDAQRNFRESLAFEKLLRLMRSMEGIIKLETFSVKFRSLARDTVAENF
ncbi:hypothetical protein PEBR_42669 [Penicillium brasilianum]|uniref:ABM domain-containing protein n=1 Tax=Penicillium brasilianum TaxID=104259 RepID=A0A1S9R7R6_PENBI|nr:hypothetical protein PEBR_42669 [Penicillium brasilianum]